MDTLKTDMITAMKSGDSVRVGTIRFLVSAVRNLAIDKYGADWETKMTDADVLDVVKKQVKTHKESIDAFTKANRLELAAKEEAELAVLSVMLPSELSDAEIIARITPVISGAEKDFGKLMRAAMGAVSGGADGGRVSALLKTLIKN